MSASEAASGGGESYQWAYSIVDSSRVSTFFISILLIVYGSFRSLALEEDKSGENVTITLTWLTYNYYSTPTPEMLDFFSWHFDYSMLLSAHSNLKWPRAHTFPGFQNGYHSNTFYFSGDKDKEDKEPLTGNEGGGSKNGTSVQTLDSLQAMCLPLGASISLLVMFFFFDSMQMLFASCTAVIATVALAFLLLPMCQYLMRPCGGGKKKHKISLGVCGRFTSAELLSVGISVAVVFIWIMTGHWLLMDALGMGLCVAFIAFVRLPSLKVSTLLLSGLLLYDVFWVFFSQYIFNANVMVKVSNLPMNCKT